MRHHYLAQYWKDWKAKFGMHPHATQQQKKHY
jgi:hypothetical protein